MSRRPRRNPRTKPAKGARGRNRPGHGADARLQAAVDAVNGGDAQTGFDLALDELAATDRDDAAQVAAQAALYLPPPDARAAFARLAGLRPDDPGIVNDWGGLLCQAGEFREAAAAFRHVLALAPDNLSAQVNLGHALLGMPDAEAAEAAFRGALDRDANCAAAFDGLGAVADSRRQWKAAAEAYMRAVDLEPSNDTFRRNLELALIASGTGAEIRERMYRAALLDQPNDIPSLFALAGVLHDQRRIAAAREVVARLFRLDLDEDQEARARFLCGELDFLDGDRGAAWEGFSWRRKAKRYPNRPHVQPYWNGESLAGKSVLVWGEQGIGEMIMFSRFFPQLIAAASRVVYETEARMVSLFQRTFPEIEVIAAEDPPARAAAATDVQTAIGDLGRWFWDDYLEGGEMRRFVPDTGRVAEFRARYLGEAPRAQLVGISWRSENPRFGGAKSMEPAAFAPLLKRPDTVFVDLQYGDTAEELRQIRQAAGVAVTHDQGFDQKVDVEAFFAQVAAMDAVVSISNTTLHAAGALGIPAAGLLSTVPMWRWGLAGESTPWHPSVRLFRQEAPGDWSAPLRQSLAMLDQL